MLIERMPKAQLNGRRAIRPIIEIAKNRSAIAALRSRSQAKQIAWLDSGNKAVEALGGKAVALIDNHRMPMLIREAVEQTPGIDAINRREKVIP